MIANVCLDVACGRANGTRVTHRRSASYDFVLMDFGCLADCAAAQLQILFLLVLLFDLLYLYLYVYVYVYVRVVHHGLAPCGPAHGLTMCAPL